MNKQLKLLAGECPPWASVKESGSILDAEVNALPSGKPFGPVALKIRSAKDKISVEENHAPTRWPLACPERHINDDGTFCIGEGPINSPQTSGDAALWWEGLGKFVVGQRYADTHRRWPYPRSLHHGAASDHQRELERLAAGSIFEPDVDEALHGQGGWLAGEIPRLHRTEARLTNLRAPCPRGCMRRGRPILRRKCKKRQLMFEIVREEHRRRKAEEIFWDQFSRRECCGTLDKCPLQKEGKL